MIAHEVTHAVLDGLRPRYTEPGLPDQLAFHEALADLVALLSVFSLAGVAQHLLDPTGSGTVVFPTDADPAVPRQEGRAETLRATPLMSLAEQIGSRRAARHAPGATPAGRYPALRRSVDLPATPAWRDDPAFAAPHRRAEVLVAAFMQTLTAMWAARLEPLRDDGGLDAGRVAEEGVKAAGHLLGMLLRSLDYLPPVELEFADVVDAVLTADRRLAPDDERGYRDVVAHTFARFGIVPPVRAIEDVDGAVAPPPGAVSGPGPSAAAGAAGAAGDPDAGELDVRYEHLNHVALRSSPEEVYQFLWNNAGPLDLDLRLTTRVERVVSSARVGPDGSVVQEVVADYVQSVRTTAGALPAGIQVPAGVQPDTVVELWGGGVLVFDQFGRFRLHQRKPVLDHDRQTRRLAHLVAHDLRDPRGGLGTTDGHDDARRFSLLHHDGPEAGW